MSDPIRPRIVPRAELTTAPLKIQRAAVLAALRRRPGSRSDLTRQLGLSSSTMTRIASGLLSDGWLLEAGVEAGGLGRPRTILTLNPAAGHVVTVLLGAGTMHVRIVDAGGELVVAGHRHLEQPSRPAAIARELDDLIVGAGLKSRTLAVGFSAPGVVGPGGDVVQAPDLGWREPVGLACEIRDHFGCAVTVDNDVNLMMLAETVNGVALDVTEAAFLYHGVGGIGLGILSGGEILSGAHGASGEIGLIPLSLTDPQEPPALFEASYSLAAIAHRLQERGIDDVSSPLEALTAAAEQGNDGGLLDELDLVVTRALAIVTLLLDPQLIVIGGGLRAVLRERIDDLRSRLDGWAPSAPRIELSRLGELELQLAVQTKCWDALLLEEL